MGWHQCDLNLNLEAFWRIYWSSLLTWQQISGMGYLNVLLAIKRERGFCKAALTPEAAAPECSMKKTKCAALICQRGTTSKAWPLRLPRDHQASPFTLLSNDLPSTFLLASAFIHIWGSEWSSFNNSACMEASCDADWGRTKPTCGSRTRHGGVKHGC